MSEPVRLMYIASPNDSAYCKELDLHLRPLKDAGIISTWTEQDIPPGAVLSAAWEEQWRKTDIEVILVSSDFFNSDVKHFVPLGPDPHIVIPVLIRPTVTWSGWLNRYKLLPNDSKAVSTWANRDEAWTNVVLGIAATVQRVLEVRVLHESNHTPQALADKLSELASIFESIYSQGNHDAELIQQSRVVMGAFESIHLNYLECFARYRSVLEREFRPGISHPIISIIGRDHIFTRDMRHRLMISLESLRDKVTQQGNRAGTIKYQQFIDVIIGYMQQGNSMTEPAQPWSNRLRYQFMDRLIRILDLDDTRETYVTEMKSQIVKSITTDRLWSRVRTSQLERELSSSTTIPQTQSILALALLDTTVIDLQAHYERVAECYASVCN